MAGAALTHESIAFSITAALAIHALVAVYIVYEILYLNNDDNI
jgi:hypothetical protein